MSQKYKEKVSEIYKIPVLNRKALYYVFEEGLVPEDEDLWLEFGTYDGRSVNKIALETKKNIYGFDSFEGLPGPWTGRVNSDGSFHFHAGVFNLGGGDNNFDIKKFFVFDNVKLIKGWFKDTLPGFLSQKNKKISFIHLDSDLYSSAKDVFKNCAPYIKNGCIIVFDELLGYPNFEEHEWKAWWEFVEEYNILFEWIGGNVGGVEIPKNVKNPFGVKSPSSSLPVSPSYENVAVKIINNPYLKNDFDIS
jgi:hypothetical protein